MTRARDIANLLADGGLSAEALTAVGHIDIGGYYAMDGVTIIDTSKNVVNIGNITASGYLRGPATFTIDPATHGDDTGTVVIAGNLQVDGTTTTIDSTTLQVSDLNITVAKEATNAAEANGAGLTVAGANATLTYGSVADAWSFNKDLEITGNTEIGGVLSFGDNTTDGRYDIVVGSQTTSRGMVFYPYVTFGTRFSNWDAWLGTNTRTAIGTEDSGIELATDYTTGGASGLALTAYGLNYYTWTSGELSGLSAGDTLTLGTPKFAITGGGDLQIGGTTVIDSSRNLTNINQITGESHLYKAGTSGTQTIVAIIGSISKRPTLVFSESTGTAINSGMSLEYNGTGSGDANFMSINDVNGASKFQFTSGGDFKIGSTMVIDSSRNLTNIGTISSGAINVSSGTSQPLSLTTSSGSPWHIGLTRSDIGLTSRVFAHNNPYNSWYFEHNISVAGSANWYAGNDGTGSGLDADLLDGSQGSYYLNYNNFTNTPTIPTNNNQLTNGSGFVTASDTSITSKLPLAGGTMTGSLNITANTGVTGSSAPSYTNATLEVQTASNNVPIIAFHRGGYSATALYEYDGELYTNAWISRAQTGKLISSGNYNSYAPSLTGGGASGTWGINITGNADTVDSLHASSFLRSDDNDTASGQYTFSKVNDHAIRVGTIRGTVVGSQTGEYIHMYDRVHIGSPAGWGSRNAPIYGLSTYGGADLATDTGSVTISGNTAWHAGNDGTGTGLDADLLDGYHASTTRNAANTIPIRDGNGYLQLGWINTTSGSAGTTAPDRIYGSYDGYIRYYTPANLKTVLGYLTTADEGSGNGIDADTVDGIQGDRIVYASGTNGYGSSNVGFASLTNARAGFYDVNSSGTPTSTWYSLVNMPHYGANHGHQIAGSFYSAGDLYNRNNNNTSLSAWAKIWNSVNDGSGSGLDADLLDGKQDTNFGATLATYGTTAGSSGRIRCTAPFNTNSAYMFQITVSIYSSYTCHSYVVSGYMYPTTNQWYVPKCVYTGTGSPDIFVGRDGNGKAYISIANDSYTGVRIHNMTRGYQTPLSATYDPWTITIDGGTENSVSCSVYTVVTSSNYNSYAPSLTGGGASGTWGINVTGSSASCTGNAASATTAAACTGNSATATTAASCSGNSATATTAASCTGNSATVTINYNNNSNSTYQMLWGSGNNVYGTSEIYCNPATDYLYSGSFYCGNWFRSSGATGWYSESYAGGIYMIDTTWVRVYNSKAFYVSNQIAATGNITAFYSDERLKTKTGSIENPLEKVNSLSGFKYVENDLAKELGYNNEKQQVGLSAQEVQAVLPEAVSLAPVDMETDETTGEITSKSGEEYLTVDYGKLVPLLVEAIKELTKEVDELKKRIK